MKYGIVSYEKKYLRLNGNETQNMGDWFQTIAMENLYKEWGVQDYIYISRNDAKTYDGEYVILPFNGYNTFINKISYKTNTFPLSPKIVPVFFSMHLHDTKIPDEIKSQFYQFSPIGCRDEETMINLRNHGIMSYLSGCVTVLFPKRSQSIHQKKVILVDAPKELETYIPEALKNNIEYQTQLYKISRTSGNPYMTREESIASYQRAKELLAYYRDNAALIITSRLHTAASCMAMGIPVILAKKDFDGRYGWIEKFLPLYSKDTWGNINWFPKSINFELEKETIKMCLKKQIQNAFDTYNDVFSLSAFYENRNRYNYNSFFRTALQNFKKVKTNEPTLYAIWGVIESSLILTNMIKSILPTWILKKVYDNNVNGTFEGIIIEKPECILQSAENIFYIIAASAAHNAAKEMLTKLNKYYILVDLENTDWQTNLLLEESYEPL